MIDPLTLDQMRILVAVAEQGSFSAAARKLGRVQSAVSQAIQTMEATLGLALFDRSAKTPTLTEAGRALVEDARAMLIQARNMRTRAQSIAEGLEPELTLAVDPMFPMPQLIESLAALREAFPALPATVFTEELGGAIDTLRSGAARLAIHPLPGGPPADLTADFLIPVILLPVVAAGHPLAQALEPVTREALEPHVQLVLTGRNDSVRAMRGGVVSRQVWRFADIQTRLEFLLAGFGWCRMPEHVVEPHIAAGRLKRLALAENEFAEIRLYVVYERGRPLGRAGLWLIDDLRERLKRRCVDRTQLLGRLDPAATFPELASGLRNAR